MAIFGRFLHAVAYPMASAPNLGDAFIWGFKKEDPKLEEQRAAARARLGENIAKARSRGWHPGPTVLKSDRPSYLTQ